MQTFFVSAYRSSGEVVYISYPMVRLVILLAAIVIDVARWLALNRTKIGMFVRAGVDDCEMLAASGVRVQRIFVVVFAFRAGLAGLAGVVGGTFQSLAPGEDVRLLLASPRSGAERAVHAGGWCGAGRGGGCASTRRGPL